MSTPNNRCRYGALIDATPWDVGRFHASGLEERSIVSHQQGAAANMSFGDSRNRPYQKFRGRTFVMRLPSDLGGACAPTADGSLKLNLVGNCRTIIRRNFDGKDHAAERNVI
jgi:hypothetical protein